MDDGQTWNCTYSHPAQTITKVAAFNASLVLVAGCAANGSNETFALISTDTAQTWTRVALPNAALGAIHGIVLLDAETWLLATSDGEIWRTANAASSWNRTFAALNISWSDLAYSLQWEVVLAVGNDLNKTAGILALSLDGGTEFRAKSNPQAATFVQAVPHVPVIPSSSPSPSPSSSPRARAREPSNNAMSRGLSIGLGSGAVLVVIAGLTAVVLYNKRRARNAYEAINSV